MAIFDRLFTPSVGRSSSGVPASAFLPTLGGMPSAAGVTVSQATAMTVSTVYACVTMLAHDVARCSPTLYLEQDDGTRAGVKSHPIKKLLARPNRVQTWFEFQRDMQIACNLRGNSYAVILRDGRGDPVQLIPVNPDLVTVLEAEDGGIFYNVGRSGMWLLAALRNQPIAIPSYDVFHLRGPSFNTLVGMSTISLGRDYVGLAMGQAQQQARWVSRGSHLSGYLESPKPMTEPVANRLKARWESLNSGILNAGSVAVLEDGLKFVGSKLTAADLDFINACGLTVQDCCRFFNVPPRKIGQPDSTRGSTIIQEEQVYVNSAIAPKLELFEQRFSTTFGLDEESIVLDLDEDNLLRTDALTRANIARINVLTGLTTRDEERRKERLPPKGGAAAELMAPVNTASLGSDIQGTSADGAGRPSKGSGLTAVGAAQEEVKD